MSDLLDLLDSGYQGLLQVVLETLWAILWNDLEKCFVDEMFLTFWKQQTYSSVSFNPDGWGDQAGAEALGDGQHLCAQPNHRHLEPQLQPGHLNHQGCNGCNLKSFLP